MHPPKLRGKAALLALLGAAAVGYLFWITARLPLTRHPRWDGVIGVLGGLYVCSHPAASFVDLLFFGRHSAATRLSSSALVGWITLNLVVFLLGVLAITVGATKFV